VDKARTEMRKVKYIRTMILILIQAKTYLR